MRILWAFTALLLLGACAGSKAPQATTCADPRPQICTMEYDPACGNLLAGGTRNYSSPCNACADDAVASYSADVCPELE